MESDLGKLFIGGISWDTDEERLGEYFSNYGEVAEAVIMRDRATGRARGFGFIVFADPAVAERVINDKHVIDGRTVEAKKAVPRDDQQMLTRIPTSIQGSPSQGRTKKIFVGGLPSSITESEFKIYFDQFGMITDVVVMYDHNTRRPRGFGFITFDSEEAVDRVLHKTFHELNGKMVEVKRAVPKEMSPGPNRSPFLGYNNYGLSRGGSFLDNYAQNYNLGSVGGFGVRVDGRFSPLSNNRSAFPAFGSSGYGLGMNMEQGLSPNYAGNSNYANSLGYTRMLSPFYNGNPNRYTTPIGYSGGNGRNDSVLSSGSRNVWGNGAGLNNAMNTANPGGYMSPVGPNLGVSFGNNGPNWGNSPASGQGGENAQGYNTGIIGYDNGNNNSYNLGGVGYGRTSGTSGGPASSFSASTGYEGPLRDLYRSSSSVYNDTTWRSSSPELDASAGSFRYGLNNVASEVTAKSSEGYVGKLQCYN